MAYQPAYDPYYLHQPEYGYSGEAKNGVNTLFVSGLPDDVKAREIHNLFRRRPGFDFCQLKYTGRGNQVVAFATFINHQSAMASMQALNGVKFDPQTGSILHIELARSNSTRKRKTRKRPYIVIDRRTQASTEARETSSNDGEGESDDASGSDKDEAGQNDDSEIIKSGEINPDADTAAAAVENDPKDKSIEGGNACSTLFIANLGPNCTEDELRQVISQYAGFNTLKVRARGGMPVAFADFETIEQAKEAMNGLQGSSLPSSDRGGMSIEYARSKMRKH